ncbi:MAG: NnrU family protein, partial [Leptothrix sp. (in: b-proteobacteria)]
FGGFLLWAVIDFRSARRRPAVASAVPVSASRTAITVAVGVVAWALFAFWAHGVLIGVRPFGAMVAA